MDIKYTIEELCDKIRLFTIKEKELADKFNKDLKENQEWFLSENKIIEEWFSLENKIIGKQLECLQNLLKDRRNEKIREKIREREYLKPLYNDKISKLSIERRLKNDIVRQNYENDKDEMQKILNNLINKIE
jgi:hypothetical protein